MQVIYKRGVVISNAVSLTIGTSPLPIGYRLKADSNFISELQLCHVVALTKLCNLLSYFSHIKHFKSFLLPGSSCVFATVIA